MFLSLGRKPLVFLYFPTKLKCWLLGWDVCVCVCVCNHNIIILKIIFHLLIYWVISPWMSDKFEIYKWKINMLLFFLLSYIYILNSIHRFLNIEPSLNSWNKHHFLYFIFKLFVSLCWWILFGNALFDILKWNWSLFCFGAIFMRFWRQCDTHHRKELESLLFCTVMPC